MDDEPYSLDEFLSYYGEEYGREVWTSARRVEPEVEGKPPKSPAPPPKAQKEQQLQATTGTDMTMGKTKTESPPSTSESPPPPPAKPQPKRPAREKRQASESSSTVEYPISFKLPDCLTSGWTICDCFLVVSSVVFMWLIWAVQATSGIGEAFSPTTIRSIRLLRIVRALRVTFD